MYRLLIATTNDEIINTLESFDRWERIGFRKPHIVSTVDDAIDKLNNCKLDAIGIRYDDKKVVPLLSILKREYLEVPIIHLSTKIERQEEIILQLRQFLNRINADFSNDYLSIKDMMIIEQNFFMHELLSGKVHTPTQLRRQINMMRIPISFNNACMIVDMGIPHGDKYLAGRWHYGSERLEVALRNFFGNYINDYYYALAVVSSKAIRMMITPFELSEMLTIDQGIMDNVSEALKSIEEYLGLTVKINNVAILEGPKSLISSL